MKTYSVSEPLIPNPMYVAETGSDETGDGTESNPFRQIRHAISKCKRTIKYTVCVDAGTYQSFSISNYKCIDLNLRGDIIINPNNTDYDIYCDNHSSLFLSSVSGNAKLQLNNASSSCVRISHNSAIFFNSLIEINLYNINTNNIFSCESNSFLQITCNVKHTGTLTCSSVIYLSSGSSGNIITNNSTIGNATSSSAFINSHTGAVCYINLTGNIANTNNCGFRTVGGLITVSLSGSNNAQTPVSQINGGRVFSGSSSTLNSVSPISSTQGIEDEEDIENIEDDPMFFTFETDSQPVD